MGSILLKVVEFYLNKQLLLTLLNGSHVLKCYVYFLHKNEHEHGVNYSTLQLYTVIKVIQANCICLWTS